MRRWRERLFLGSFLSLGVILLLPAGSRAQTAVPLPLPPFVPAQSDQAEQPAQFIIGGAPQKKTGQSVLPKSKKIGGQKKSITPAKKKTKKKTYFNPWKKVPPARVFPRVGNFPILPSGPGYYSGWDFLTDRYRGKPRKTPFVPFALILNSFFDIDYRYLEDPNFTDRDWSDYFHRIHLGDNWMLSTGGQNDMRPMNEVNSRLTGRNNTYQLLRTRVYTDLWYRDTFRAYVEFIDARSFNQDLPPLPIDINRTDLLNAFVDVKLAEIYDHNAYVRVGRQEILLGSQRLVSPLEWGNTRRPFSGVRVFRQGDKFDVDAFWLQPLKISPSHFDRPNSNQNFAGLWTTYRPRKGTFLDLYYLFRSNRAPPKVLGEAKPMPYDVHTFGCRWAGDRNQQILWDAELDMQFGNRSGQNIFAGAAAVGGGWHFKQLPWNPTLWCYYDYASGDNNPNNGHYGTFNQLYPFGHFYLGWADIVGRQNIRDLNSHLYLYPTKWIQIWLQFHHFNLASARDALYNPAGIASRRDPTGQAGTDVGNEIDFNVNFHINRHLDFLVGYSHLFAGRFIRQTATAPGSGRDPELFYAMYNFRW